MRLRDSALAAKGVMLKVAAPLVRHPGQSTKGIVGRYYTGLTD